MSNEKIAALLKTSVIDYPYLLSCVVFMTGCNLRCPYCYNKSLIINCDKASLVTLDDIKSHLIKRRNILKGVVISGGECLINPHTLEIIQLAKDLGYRVKLDTNGTSPQLLSNLMSHFETRPDYIAMDIKTSPERYSILNPVSHIKNLDIKRLLLDSIDIIKSIGASNYEWRTVLVPDLVTKDDIDNIASYLPEDSVWYFARFINKDCLDPSYNKKVPYSDTESHRLVDYASTLIKNSILR